MARQVPRGGGHVARQARRHVGGVKSIGYPQSHQILQKRKGASGPETLLTRKTSAMYARVIYGELRSISRSGVPILGRPRSATLSLPSEVDRGWFAHFNSRKTSIHFNFQLRRPFECILQEDFLQNTFEWPPSEVFLQNGSLPGSPPAEYIRMAA